MPWIIERGLEKSRSFLQGKLEIEKNDDWFFFGFETNKFWWVFCWRVEGVIWGYQLKGRWGTLGSLLRFFFCFWQNKFSNCHKEQRGKNLMIPANYDEDFMKLNCNMEFFKDLFISFICFLFYFTKNKDQNHFLIK